MYPVILEDSLAPRLRVYNRATVIAEKFEAIVSLGMANSRMKGFFDLAALAREGIVDMGQLGNAIRTTFQRRGTLLPHHTPVGLSDEFARNPSARSGRDFL